MEYVRLGRSGVRISRICLGTAAFGVVPQAEKAQALVDKALELGINFFDTATSYGNRSGQDRPGVPAAEKRKSAEEILGDCLASKRDQAVIATKVQERVGEGVNEGGPDGGLSRYHIMKRLELSLKRLRTDHIDLYYAHHPDPTTPLEETLRTFDDLVRQGMVRYIGLSTFPGWQVANVMWKTEKYNLEAPVCHQIYYNLLTRAIEREAMPASREFGLGLAAFTPPGGGLLTGADTLKRPIAELGMQRWRGGQGPGFSAAELAAAEKLDAYAGEWGLPAAQVALQWVLSRPAVATAIIGPENPEELAISAAATDVTLTPEQFEAVDAIGRE